MTKFLRWVNSPNSCKQSSKQFVNNYSQFVILTSKNTYIMAVAFPFFICFCWPLANWLSTAGSVSRRRLRDELMHGGLSVGPARLQQGGRKTLLVDRVRKVLTLETQGAAVDVGQAALASLAHEEVPRVQLQTGLRREDLQHSARAGIAQTTGTPQVPRCSIQNIIVVVAQRGCPGQGFDAFTDARRSTEVQGAPGDTGQLPRGDQGVVAGCVTLRFDLA